MPRRKTRKALAKSIRDLRQATGNGEQGSVSIEPASSTTTDEPKLTKSSIAPEASPAAEKKASKPKAKS